jgi:two-component system sensor histidine kinase KdpD
VPGTIKEQLGPYIAALAVVAASSTLAYLVFSLTGNANLSPIFLGGVLIIAYLFGSVPAYFAAGLAFLIYDFFLVEPRFTLTFTASDICTLVGFLAVAMLTGRLTGRVKDEARRAEARAGATQALFAATRTFSGSSDEEFIRDQLARRLSIAAKGQAFLSNGPTLICCPPDLSVPPGAISTAHRLEHADPGVATETVPIVEWRLRPLVADGAVLGVVGWKTRRDANRDDDLVAILADVGAAAIARARLAAGKSEAEARARTEDLRNALLSSISHDLRTPLAAIMASASSLSEFGESFDAPTRKDLAANIQQGAERLDSFVANLLNMTRLESGALTVQRVAFSAPEIIERVISRHCWSSERPVRMSIAPDLPEALGDPVLFERAFWNVFENAVRYAPDARAISIGARSDGDELDIRVEDEGPGLPETDLTRIFDKFFRSSATAHVPGTGLGLSITKGLIEGMGGEVGARLRDDGKTGLVVSLKVPAAT